MKKMIYVVFVVFMAFAALACQDAVSRGPESPPIESDAPNNQDQVDLDLAAAKELAVFNISGQDSYLRDQATNIPVMPNWSSEIAAIKNLDISIPDSNPPSEDGAVQITLADNNNSAGESENVTINGNQIVITKVGTYILSGTLSDGTVIVETENNVSLILKNANITSGGTAKHTAIAFYGTGNYIVSIAAGTTNTLVDYNDPKKYNSKDKPKGAIYSEKDLTINGSGNLSLTAFNHSGLYAKGKLKIADGHITVTAAPNSALRGDEGVIIKGGTFNLKSVKDTIKAEAADENDYIYIGSANITIETITGETLYKEDASKAGYYVNPEGVAGWDGDGISATKAVWMGGGALSR